MLNVKKGFVEGYTRWIKHGENTMVDMEFDEHIEIEVEAINSPSTDATDSPGEADFDVEELLCHIEPHILINAGTTKGLDKFYRIEKASKDPLYEEYKGCGKVFTVLCTVLELMKLKASFMDLLELIFDALPKPNLLPRTTDLAKKLISPLLLGVQKNHACPNHCILYRKEH